MQIQNRTQPKPGKPPVINIKKPQIFVLQNGLKIMIVENHKLPRVTFNLALDNEPFTEGNKKGVDELTSNLLGNGSFKITKDDFHEEIDFLGASIDFNSHGAYATSLSKFAERTLELLAEGTLNPNFNQEELDSEKAKLIEKLKSQEKSVSAISHRVVDALTFGAQHPSGEYITEETIEIVTLEDIKRNYETYFVPENAYLIIVGDIKLDKIKPVIEQLFGSWKKKNTPKLPYPAPENVAFTQINFVDVPNAVQSEISLVHTVNLKMNDPDYFSAIIANQILGGGYNGYLNMNLREKNAWTYGASSNIGSGKYVSKLIATSAIRSTATDSAVVEFIKEIKRIRTERVSPEILNEVKAGFIGRFVMQVEKPQAVARYALNIETENLPADFYENYIQTINAVTADDVLRAANKYYLINNTRIIIAGKGSEILPGLENLGIPIFYFDTYGNPTPKPEYKNN